MLNTILSAIFQLLALTPLLIICIRKNAPVRSGALVIAALFFVAISVVNYMFSSVVLFEHQQWNWAGKFAELLLALLFIYFYSPVSAPEFGCSIRPDFKDTKPLMLFSVAYFIFRLGLYLSSASEPFSMHTETVLFQASLPGLAEETVFRGVLLTLVHQALQNPQWSILKVSFGWGAIITSVLFGLVHGLTIENSENITSLGIGKDEHIAFNAFAACRTAFDGFLFALLAQKTKSLLPGIVYHNLLNLIGSH